MSRARCGSICLLRLPTDRRINPRRSHRVREGLTERALDARALERATLDDLPAVSEDGRRIAVAARVADGARARDNLALGLIDVDTDHVTKWLVVVDANDPDRPGREDRTTEANRLEQRD